MKMSFTLLFLAASLLVQAQTEVTNTGTLYVSGSTDILYVSGGFTNGAGSALTNNGQLHVLGNLSNSQASMATGTGTLYLSGSSTQQVNGTASFRTYHLVTNNSAGVTLNNHLSITGVHTFTAGRIASSATPHYLVYEAGASYTGENDVRHVTGWVKKIGTTDFSFPLGNGTYLRKIAILGLTAASEYNAAHAGTTANATAYTSPISTVSTAENWVVNKVSGGSARVTLNWDDSKVGFPNYVVSDIRAIVYSGSSWINAGGTASGSSSGTGSITSDPLTTIGFVGFGSTSFAVPLSFTGFSAERKKDHTLLEWVTAHEEHVGKFDVERSVNGAPFVSVATLAATNNRSSATYTWKDEAKGSGAIAYRIRATDLDGAVKYTRIVRLNLQDAEVNVTIAGRMPPSGLLPVTLTGVEAGELQFKLVNMGGQTLRSMPVSYSGSGGLQLPVGGVPPGIYIVELQAHSRSFRQKIIVP